MKTFDCQNIRNQVLRASYKLAPFNVRGGLEPGKTARRQNFISCLIISNKIDHLIDLLSDLSSQSLSRDDFEIIIVFATTGG